MQRLNMSYLLKLHLKQALVPTAKAKEAYEKDIQNDLIYQQLYKDAKYPSLPAPRTPVLQYNLQTRSLG